MGRFEAVPDNLSPEEILAQAKAAAKDAADMLTLREPKSKVGEKSGSQYIHTINTGIYRVNTCTRIYRVANNFKTPGAMWAPNLSSFTSPH